MKVLVTGGTGFLGGFLLPRLTAAGHDVTGLKLPNERPAVQDVDWIDADLAEPLTRQTLPEKVDGVIHLAQSPRYREGRAGEAHVFAVNVAGLAGLLNYAESAGADRFITASSGSVYEPFKGGLHETAAVSPTSYYAASKLSAEALTNACADRFKVANLRVFFLYGPGQKQMLIARLIDQVRDGVALKLPSRGDGLVFPPTYADDTARAFQAAFEDGWSGPINVASPFNVTFRRLAEAIGEAVQRPAVIERGDAPLPVPITPSLAKLGRLMDIGEFHTIDEGLAKTVAG